MDLTKLELLDHWRMMFLIREFELTVSSLYSDGKIPGFIHLSIGQEAIAVGVCAALEKRDYLYIGHRGHGQCLAKGADVRKMMAEIFGKEPGYCRGRGGSIHIASVENGVMGANGIVGGNLPIAVGAAYAVQTLNKDSIVITIFGDGAVNEGVFHESLNIASLWALPIIFVCENNAYAQFTAIAASHANQEIFSHANSYNIPGVRIDGNDFEAVYETTAEAIERARGGAGPTLIECMTYRWHGHYEGDPEKYRKSEEVENWKSRDPIRRLEGRLQEDTNIDKLLVEWTEEVAKLIDDAVKFAESSPVSDAGETLEGVYAGAINSE
jgi:pyruvate dehydrogenase E1 component alpha subunit